MRYLLSAPLVEARLQNKGRQMTELKNTPPERNQPDIIDRWLTRVAISWLIFSVCLSITHYQNLRWWDFAGTVIGAVTACGYCLKLKAHQTMQEFMTFVLVFALMFMLTMFLPRLAISFPWIESLIN
jgi:hypothetical protein